MSGAAQGSGDAKHRWNGCEGRSRGGLTTKVHALFDANGLPIALKLTADQARDGRAPPTCSTRSAMATCCSATAIRIRPRHNESAA